VILARNSQVFTQKLSDLCDLCEKFNPQVEITRNSSKADLITSTGAGCLTQISKALGITLSEV
jgi:hypothetical protein